MIPLHEITGNKKRSILLIILVTLMLISWTGILDRIPYKYLDSSFTNATISYVASRSINAAVSVMQTAEVGFLGFTSIQIGQMLDPINDMAERFSDLIVVAIASIATQKILLTIVSSIFFKALLTISGLILIVSILLKKITYIEVLTRTFIFLVFLRLALSLMVLLNYTVDVFFLDEDIKNNQIQIQRLSYELDEISDISEKKKGKGNSVDINAIFELDITNLLQRKEKLNSELKIQSNKLLKLQENVNGITNSIDQAKESLSLIDRYNPLRKDDELEAMENNLSIAVAIVTEKEADIEKINKIFKDIDKSITYKRNVIAGESNESDGIVSNIISGISGFFNGIDVREASEIIDKKIDSLLNLFVLYVMKTLLLPIMFMYFLLKAFKLIWAIDLAELIKREAMTLNPIDPPVTTEAK